MALKAFYCVVVLAVLGISGYWAWRTWQGSSQPEAAPTAATAKPPVGSVPVRISPQAKANMSLISSPIKPTAYWRTAEFPATIVEKPGVTSRGVVAPIAGVVSKIHSFPGDTVAASAPLATLRLLSDSVYSSQLELFKATKDSEITKSQIERLSAAAQSGALPKSRLIELENELDRQTATIQAYRQDLQARGIAEDQIDMAGKGDFLTEIIVSAPAQEKSSKASEPSFTFEVESLEVELGQQVAAGDVLFKLADHSELLIEGRGFKDDLPLIQAAVNSGWNAEVDLPTSPDGDWPELSHEFPIDRVSNSIDPATRTFGFFLALSNQQQTYSRDGKNRVMWRFRPGSQLRLRVPVEKFENVFVVPQAAVVWEGPEAFVFQQDGIFFHRKPVQVLQQDRLNAVVAAGASVRSGDYLAQGSAASLNRIMKSQAQEASGAPPGVHVHPDGTTHAAH